MLDSKIEQGTKILAIVLAISYGIGLIVSNGYLASLGVLDFDLLRPKAALTGVWFIMFLAVGLITEDSVQYAFKMKGLPPGYTSRNAIWAFAGGVSFYFMCFAVAFVLPRLQARAGGIRPILSMFGAAVLQYVLAGTTVTEMQNARKEWIRRRTDARLGPTSSSFFIFHCAWALLALGFFAHTFVVRFYQYIPQQYGGGRPEYVELAVTENAAKILSTMSVSLSSQNISQGSVELIHQNAESFAFRASDGRTIIVPRSEILAVRAK